ncbi:MAG: acyltransferase family protein [Paludibacter sp.]
MNSTELNNDKTNMQTRDINVDVLRILACFFVVVVHVSGTSLTSGITYSIGSIDWFVCYLSDLLARWCVPVFVMISGGFLLNPAKPVTIKKLFTKYILRILIALIFWSVFYGIIFHTAFLPLGNQAGHLWYLPMIIGIYMVIPFFQIIPEKLLRYFVVVWFVFQSIAFIAKFITPEFKVIDIEHYFFMDYVGFFVLGFLLYTNRESKQLQKISYPAGIISVLLMVFLSVSLSLKNNETNQQFFSYFSPLVILISTAIFLFVLNIKFNVKTATQKIILSISYSTFGIYLIHIFLLANIYTRVTRFIHEPILFVPIICLGTFTLAYILISIIRKIPFISKYIV